MAQCYLFRVIIGFKLVNNGINNAQTMPRHYFRLLSVEIWSISQTPWKYRKLLPWQMKPFIGNYHSNFSTYFPAKNHM